MTGIYRKTILTKGKGQTRTKKKKKAEKEDDEEELEQFLTKLKMRRIREPIKRLPPRKVGGGRPAPRVFGFPHFPRIPSEPKPKPEKWSYSGKVEPWTEPSTKHQPKVIKYEVDTEKMIKELEKGFDEKLLNKVLERMDKDFRDQLEAMEVKDYGELPQEDSEKPVEKFEEIKADNPSRDDEPTEGSHEIAGSLFYDSMAGSVPRKDIEIQGENVETEERQDVIEDRYLEDEAEDLRDIEAEPNEDQIEGETSTELPEAVDTTETEPIQDEIKSLDVPEPSIDVIEQIEAEDLSPLEAELYQELVEPTEAEEQVEAEGY